MTGEAVDRTIAWIARALAALSGILILAIALLVAGDVLARNIAGIVLFHAFEVSTYLFAAALSFGLAHTLVVGGNIRLDMLYGRFPAALRRALDLASLVAIAAVATILARMAWKLALQSQARGVTSPTELAVPLALPQAIWAAGLTVLALTGMWLSLRHAYLLIGGRAAEADRLGAIPHAALGTAEGDGP